MEIVTKIKKLVLYSNLLNRRIFIMKFLLPISLIIFAVFCGILSYKSISYINDHHFSSLSYSFINNDLYLSPFNLPTGDYADYMAKQYLFYGPLPSIILIPFVLIFGKEFSQNFLSIAGILTVYISILLISRKFKFSKQDSIWLATFFVFGTVFYFLTLVNISAYLAQVVGTTFVILALLTYLSRKNWLLVGIFIAAAGFTRLTLFGASIFFLWELVKNQNKNTLRNLLLLIIPIIVSILVLGFYNNRRFHSPFESGYRYNVTLKTYPLKTNLDSGLFNINYVPSNLYALLLKGPDPIIEEGKAFILKFPYLKVDGWGLSIFFTSPLFIYLIRVKKTIYSVPAVLTIVILLMPSILYFGIGFSQFGYRYSLDFLPFLFLILISAFSKGLPPFAKFLIFIGIIFNSLYMLSIWDYYPVFEFFGLQ